MQALEMERLEFGTRKTGSNLVSTIMLLAEEPQASCRHISEASLLLPK